MGRASCGWLHCNWVQGVALMQLGKLVPSHKCRVQQSLCSILFNEISCFPTYSNICYYNVLHCSPDLFSAALAGHGSAACQSAVSMLLIQLVLPVVVEPRNSNTLAAGRQAGANQKAAALTDSGGQCCRRLAHATSVLEAMIVDPAPLCPTRSWDSQVDQLSFSNWHFD